MYEFRWNDWNTSHIAEHGVTPVEAEWVVLHARPPYPDRIGDQKMRVWGKTGFGRIVQVIFIVDPEGTLYVIHARDLNEREKRLYRRRIR